MRIIHEPDPFLHDLLSQQDGLGRVEQGRVIE